MHTERMSKAHWRKSAQWFALSRPLAAVVARDDHVARVFQMQCYSYTPKGTIPPPPHIQARRQILHQMDSRGATTRHDGNSSQGLAFRLW